MKALSLLEEEPFFWEELQEGRCAIVGVVDELSEFDADRTEGPTKRKGERDEEVGGREERENEGDKRRKLVRTSFRSNEVLDPLIRLSTMRSYHGVAPPHCWCPSR